MLTLLVSTALITAASGSPCDALKIMPTTYKGEVPPGFVLTLNAPGADYRNPGGADDVGPPEEVKQCMSAVTGANLDFLGADWKDCEPNPPGPDGKRSFVWDKLKQDVARTNPKHYLWMGFGYDNRWDKNSKFWGDALANQDEVKWWTLVEGFMTEAAKVIRELHPQPEPIFYHPPGNEMSLTGKPDWAFTYMAPVKHWYPAIKRADKRNIMVVGALVVGNRAHVGALYEAGFKDCADALDIHCYDDTGGKAHFSIAQIIESHQVMVEHGDGAKPIWLGEGWAPLPLPASVDKRDYERHKAGLGMSTEPYTYTPDEVEHYRKSIIRGWYNMMTPRKTYDPKWVLGASYFTLNDMWGGIGWKARAKEKHDAQGNLTGWDLDGYDIPYQPFAMDAVYRPWGIIDGHGWPKGEIVLNVPPYLPKHDFAAIVDAPKDGDGVSAQLIAGQPYTVTLTFTSKEQALYKASRVAMDTREKCDTKISFKALDLTDVGDLQQGQTVTRRFEVTLPPELIDRKLCLLGELYYTWAERIPYYASAWLDVHVLPAARQAFSRSAAIAPDTTSPVEITVKLNNPTASIFRTICKPAGDNALVFEPQERSLSLLAGEAQDVTFAVRLAANAGPGTYAFHVDTGSALTRIESDVTFPLTAADPTSNPWGLLHNGGFEDQAGEKHARDWSGDQSNWAIGGELKDLPDAGQQCTVYAANGVTTQHRLSQTFGWPGPGAKRGALHASVMVKGLGFEENASPFESSFRLRLVALDAKGQELAKQESDVFKGTGKWETFSHKFNVPPENAAYLRFEIATDIARGNGWHLHYIDNAKLTVE